MDRGNFSSKLGIVLATAGSAVGLGNIWRFPYMTGENGGAAFLILYVLCILMLGLPGMLAEFIVGRHGQANASRSYDSLSKGRPWKWVGHLGILTSTIILGFYAVVAGWCCQYLYASLAGQTLGDKAYIGQYFTDFVASPWKPVLWGVVFILITHWVIVRGVRKGIEKASKLLMPILLLLLVILVIASCMLPGASEGITFLFKPDFTKINSHVMLEALGQAFFSLSLGTACLCTYASYFDKQVNLVRSASEIVLLDTIIAIMAGLMIFPAAASVGINPDSGPSLIFITLPNVFQQAFGSVPLIAAVVSIMFYALLVFAALTSTISMHEIGTAFFTEEFSWSRKQAAWLVTTVAAAICILCCWSVGGTLQLKLLGMNLLDFCDQLTANFMLPLGAMLTCLFVGWYIPRQTTYREFTNENTVNGRLFAVFFFAVRFICPLAIMFIILHQLHIV